jgi:DNA primase catalytic subunit
LEQGVIIYDGMPINKDQERAISLGQAKRKEIGPYVPVIGVDAKYAAELLAAAKDKRIFNIDVQVKNRWITTTNMIAETKGGARIKL